MYVEAETPALPVENGVAASLPEVLGAGNGIAWRPALRSAIMLAVPAALFCSGLTLVGQSLGFVWMGSAAAWAVAMYARRTRQNKISKRNGARIGLVTGLLASWLTLGVDGVHIWLARFVLHQGSQIDADWTDQVNKIQQVDGQMFAQLGAATAQMSQELQAQRLWMLSSDGRAGAPFMFYIMGTVFLIIFAAIGGAVGARLFAQPRSPNV
jgi:hypothetical protein